MLKRRREDSIPWEPGKFITDSGWTTAASQHSPLNMIIRLTDEALRKMQGK